MRKAIVWIGVIIILISLIVVLVGTVLGYSAYGTIIDGLENDSPSQIIDGYKQDRGACLIGGLGSLFFVLGIAISFMGLLLEETFRPLGPRYPPQEQQTYPPQQPSRFPEPPPPPPPQP